MVLNPNIQEDLNEVLRLPQQQYNTLRCCCPDPQDPQEFRIFVHWVWDCVVSQWIPHHRQVMGWQAAPNSECETCTTGIDLWEWLRWTEGSQINLRPVRTSRFVDQTGTTFIGTTSVSRFWEMWRREWIANKESLAPNMRVAHRPFPEDVSDEEIWAGLDWRTGYGFNPWEYYRNVPMFLRFVEGLEKPEWFNGDIIYEGNWNDPNKKFFHVPANARHDLCRQSVAEGDPLPGFFGPSCVCDILAAAYDINAVTVSEDTFEAPITLDKWPAPPPPPPTEWSDFLCTDCEDSPTPPPVTTPEIVIPDPPPNTKCQVLHKYIWNCVSEAWDPETSRLILPSEFPPGFEQMYQLSLWRYGGEQICTEDIPPPPEPSLTPDPVVRDLYCPVPSSCPCATWLPDSWPCGGLLEQYTASANVKHGCAPSAPNSSYNVTLSPTVAPASQTQCQWSASGPEIFDNFSEGNCQNNNIRKPNTSANVLIRLSLAGGQPRWNMTFSYIFRTSAGSFITRIYSFIKTSGLTPIGAYGYDLDGSFPGNDPVLTGTATVS